jgi:hypothetical protein
VPGPLVALVRVVLVVVEDVVHHDRSSAGLGTITCAVSHGPPKRSCSIWPASTPHLAEMAAEHILRPGYHFGDEVEVGLTVILDALTRSIPRRRQPAPALTARMPVGPPGQTASRA